MTLVTTCVSLVRAPDMNAFLREQWDLPDRTVRAVRLRWRIYTLRNLPPFCLDIPGSPMCRAVSFGVVPTKGSLMRIKDVHASVRLPCAAGWATQSRIGNRGDWARERERGRPDSIGTRREFRSNITYMGCSRKPGTESKSGYSRHAPRKAATA